MFYIYIIETSRHTLYVGQTADLARRLEEHRSKSARSSKYLRGFASLKLVYSESCATRSDALKREAVLKKLTHQQKLELIRANIDSTNNQ